jgi:bifunctional non-homologous end joining protein LigD
MTVKGEGKTLLDTSEDIQIRTIKGRKLKFSNLSKVFWPEDGYTKRDLINYYDQIAPYIVPYLKNRPQSLNRYPNGIVGFSFYQKDVTQAAPEWMKKYPYRTSSGEHKNFLILQNEADLLWMANLGAIEMNPWSSTIQKPDYPNWCIIDIDPSEKNSFEQVIQTALSVKEVLGDLKIEGYCKTSGATGMHIYIPMGVKYTYEQSQLLARMIAMRAHMLCPRFTSIERPTAKRPDKVYLDFLQNRREATLAAPYSARPKPGAPVSMPLHWDEVKKGLKPKQFNIKNAFQRVKSEGDLFKPVLGRGINLRAVFKALTKS